MRRAVRHLSDEQMRGFFKLFGARRMDVDDDPVVVSNPPRCVPTHATPSPTPRKCGQIFYLFPAHPLGRAQTRTILD